MASKKVTVTLPEELVERAKELAEEEGIALSTFVAYATAQYARTKIGLAAMREWDEKYGPPSAEDEAWVDEQIGRMASNDEETRLAS